ncbi:hypothetical protein [Salinispora oceanensis]|uniref:hypothetical protein n=1 Tax=Salinispora oceanensis TaxID=1050199 RepID=UPI0003751B05|nr:hypothetical protein [Salinispora oceanensis]
MNPSKDTVIAPPVAIMFAYWSVIVGTVAALLSNVLELTGKYGSSGNDLGATTDLVLTIAFIAMFGFFVEMMRKGRQWGRVMLTIFGLLGLMFTVLGLFGIAGRPIDGTAQVILGVIGALASVAGVAFMYLPAANAWFRTVREPSRVVSQPLRKVMLTAHVAISVGWLGLIMGMLAMAITAVLTDDPRTQYSVYDMMNLLDQIFLGMTSLFALLTGVVGAAGTKWHLMRRHWVATKFVTTVLVMIFGFGVIHQLILTAYNQVLAGAPVEEVRQTGIPLAICSGLAVCILIFMTAVSTYKPWGMTRYGQRRQRSEPRKASRPRRETPSPVEHVDAPPVSVANGLRR